MTLGRVHYNTITKNGYYYGHGLEHQMLLSGSAGRRPLFGFAAARVHIHGAQDMRRAHLLSRRCCQPCYRPFWRILCRLEQPRGALRWRSVLLLPRTASQRFRPR